MSDFNDSKTQDRIPRRATAAAWRLAGLLWLAAVSGGMLFMLNYSESAGMEARAPAQWPKTSRVIPSLDRPTLLMFIHPQCPCSRASVGELDRLMAAGPGRIRAHVLFIRPKGMTDEWVNSDLWRQAVAIPGVMVRCDEGGREAARFQALTSGQTLLYDQHGALVFAGGITASRGHFGDSDGRAAVLALLDHKVSGRAETPVFGCSLCESGGAE